MIADPDEPMNEANYEFSDPEIDLIEEPVAVVPRTRSQSRANDVPAPPPEPVKKQTRVKRAKKIDPDYDPRPRRRIREADSIEYEDEWTFLRYQQIIFYLVWWLTLKKPGDCHSYEKDCLGDHLFMMS